MTLPTRWIKVIKDVWSYRSRSILVILSIAVGVAAVGTINNAAKNIQRDLYSEFDAGNPAHLELFVSPFQNDLAIAVEGMREVEAAQAHRVESAQILNQDGSLEDIDLHTVFDISDIHVNRFTIEEGANNLGIREIFIERQSAESLNLSIGDLVTVEMPDEREFKLTVVGIVHDVYVMPISILGNASGYVTMETLEWMGAVPYFNRIDVITSIPNPDKSSVLNLGAQIRDRIIEPAGYTVGAIRIPGIGSEPGAHWAQNQIKGFLLILQIMGIMAVLLTGGLIINTISAIITQQIKQIGIMRSFGAERRQIIGIYLFNVLLLSILGLILAIPLGMFGAFGLSKFAANFLNFNVHTIQINLQVILMQIFLGILMPIMIAFFPIYSGTRISAYQAIYQYGVTKTERQGLLARSLSNIRQLNPPIVMSFRNTFRKKSRLLFTIITLTLAGAMFIAAFSTRSSLNSQIKDFGRYILYDATIDFPGGVSKFAAEREALRVQGINYVEGWAQSSGYIVSGVEDNNHEIEIIGLPYNSQTVAPLILDGKWLMEGDHKGVVINEDLLEDYPDLAVGNNIEIKIDEIKRGYQVIGIVSKHLSGSRIYMHYQEYERLSGVQNQINQLRVIAIPGKPSPPLEQEKIASKLKERFDNAMLHANNSTTRQEFLGYFTDVFNIILIVLIIMAGMLAVVGGLGLTGAMGINILERTREIGVLRAVGASNFTVRKIVVIEGVVVGFISWLMGAIFSAPSGWALASAVIYAVLKTTPRFHYSFPGLMIWFMVVMSIGVLGSLAPALQAARLKVREVLDYE